MGARRCSKTESKWLATTMRFRGYRKNSNRQAWSHFFVLGAHNAHCITELFPALAEPPYLPYGALSALAVNSNSFPSPQSLYSMGSCCCTACCSPSPSPTP